MDIVIDKERQKAKQRLTNILEQLSELGDEAERLIDDHFPEASGVVSAYNLCQFGYDYNPYSESLDKVVDGLEIEFEEEEDSEDE